MSATLSPYPFGDPADDPCDCRYHCYPQFRAGYQNQQFSRTKFGHEEFTTPSNPPRRFRHMRSQWRVYDENADAVAQPRYAEYWTNSLIDADTGADTTTTSSPPPPPAAPFLGAWSFPGDFTELSNTLLSTFHRQVWELTGSAPGDGDYVRVELIETLDTEFTTEQLIALTIADFASWPAFADGDEDTDLSSAGCYSGGIVPNGTAGMAGSNLWALSADELTFECRRQRYVVRFPPLLPGTYAFSWQEVFIPEGAEASPGDWVVLATCGVSGVVAADTETTPLELTETRENGRVYVLAATLEEAS